MNHRPNTRSSIPVPEVVSAGELPPETLAAAHEMVAHLLRQDTPMATITLKGVTYEGKPLGDFTITIESQGGVRPLGLKGE